MRKIVDFLVRNARLMRINCVILAILFSFSAFGAYTIDGHIARDVDNYVDLIDALGKEEIETIILKKCIILEDGAIVNGDHSDWKKTIQVEKPFLPENGKVTIGGTGNSTYIVEPKDGDYSTYNLFEIKAGSKVTIKHVTLMGGFTGKRTVGDDPSVGGIDNYGYLDMEGVDMLRTGTALLNRPNARALLVKCNIVRNANWYGGGILNFSERKSSTSDEYINGGTLVMDSCSLTENESLGPAHGGGAAENQGLMLLNNCVVANNASTEIGGGINNCKGGALFVMNSTFTGNITTSGEYGTMAGGAIGNAGGASHVHIVNSILAYNGYDDGESVVSSSLGRYNEAQQVHTTLQHSIYDALAGFPNIDTTGSTKEYEDIFSSVQNSGIIAAGATRQDGITSSFDHPLVEKTTDSWSLSPVMLSQPTNHNIFVDSVTTYFCYDGIFEETWHIHMAYEEDGVVKALGEKVTVPPEEELEKCKVIEGFGGSEVNRSDNNFIGACAVPVVEKEEEREDITLFTVKLGDFTGGRVSGVTIYNDSYRSNSVVTVHGIPDSAHYLDGWIIDKEKVSGDNVKVAGSEQQYIFSFTVTDNIIITPIFTPVETKIIRVRQRYPWNNLVDIDYSVSEKDAVDYRLVFIASYTEDGTNVTKQLKSFVKNSGKNEQGKFEEQRLGWKQDLRKAGEHRVTWDSAKDGVRLKGAPIALQLMACEGDER